jgi:glycosyltransferase involved in cell wall biosynthesis
MVQPANITIVIPCFNEADNLNLLIQKIIQLDLPIKFIVVDNGSKDSTKQVMKSFGSIPNIEFLFLTENRGYGGGIKAGLNLATTEYIGWTHADLQTDINDLKIAANICKSENVDFVKGFRIKRNIYEKIFSVGMTIVEFAIFGMWLSDINAQPTIVKKDIYTEWVDTPDDFSLDLSLMHFVRSRRVKERRFDVIFHDRIYGHSKWNFGFKDKLKFILRTVKYSAVLRLKK